MEEEGKVKDEEEDGNTRGGEEGEGVEGMNRGGKESKRVI